MYPLKHETNTILLNIVLERKTFQFQSSTLNVNMHRVNL
jgi:hypothetical protein